MCTSYCDEPDCKKHRCKEADLLARLAPPDAAPPTSTACMCLAARSPSAAVLPQLCNMSILAAASLAPPAHRQAGGPLFQRSCPKPAGLRHLSSPVRQRATPAAGPTRGSARQLAAAGAVCVQSDSEEAQSSSQPSSSGRKPVQRALGLDYGRRVVGLAVSTMGLAPRPLEGLPGCRSLADVQATASAVLEVAVREACDAIVVGLPVTSAGSLRDRGSDSQQGRRCRNFACTLASLAKPRGLHVFLVDERGSTLEARHLMAASGSRRATFGKRKDSVAAAVILASFFEDPSAAAPVYAWRPRSTGDQQQQGQRQSQQKRQQEQQQEDQQQEQQQEEQAAGM